MIEEVWRRPVWISAKMKKRGVYMKRNTKQGVKRTKNKNKKRIGLFLAILIGMIAILYLAVSFYFRSHFLPHTTINGVDSSGYTVEKVEHEIAQEIKNYTLTIEMREDRTEEINGKDISIEPQFDGSIENLLKKQNEFEWMLSFFKKYDYQSETMVAYDETALEEAVENLDCVQEENQIAPVNAKVSEYSEENGYVIVPAEYGTTLSKESVIAVVKDAVISLAESVSLDENGCYIDPEITQDSENIKNAVNTLNQYVNTKITYDFGEEKEVLDASVLNSWLSVSDAMEPVISEEKLSDYVKTLAAKHNTAGKSKTLNMTDGGTVEVPGGSYGWKIDQAAEREQLLNDIKNGGIVEREPEYAQRANSYKGNDYGNSYVEINLTSQHLYLYKDGALVISTDFVSGKVATGNDTPTGAYFINSKETERTLKGPDYESFVNYWMPFNGDIGMHDATWRSSFGGNIYLRGGSHGCINLPVSAAKTIFANIEVGTPVLVFRTEPVPDVTETVAPEVIIAEINSIGPVTLESETIMNTIRTQYNALPDADKAKITNYQILVDDEVQLAALKAASGQ